MHVFALYSVRSPKRPTRLAVRAMASSLFPVFWSQQRQQPAPPLPSHPFHGELQHPVRLQVDSSSPPGSLHSATSCAGHLCDPVSTIGDRTCLTTHFLPHSCSQLPHLAPAASLCAARSHRSHRLRSQSRQPTQSRYAFFPLPFRLTVYRLGVAVTLIFGLGAPSRSFR